MINSYASINDVKEKFQLVIPYESSQDLSTFYESELGQKMSYLKDEIQENKNSFFHRPDHSYIEGIHFFLLDEKVPSFKNRAIKIGKYKSELFVIDPSYLKQETQADQVLPIIFAGINIASYEINTFHQDKKENEPVNYGVISENNEIIAFAEKGIALGETTKKIIHLVNLPANLKTTHVMADHMINSGRENGYDVKVLEKEELSKLGMGALLAVNQGSPDPAKLLIGDYHPKNAQKIVALVGKGVTFDTGGLSIKGSNNMHYMKSDMGGAAAVMGVIEIVAKLKLPVRVICVVPTTDNSVDMHAVKPGDIVKSYSGKSVEIIDTDAEGRLILADALTYSVKTYQPDVLIDMATLTGSIIRAIGTEAAGLWSTDDTLAAELFDSGLQSGERLWRMPLWDDYDQYMKSDMADLRNLGTKPMAGSITAAKFLQHFTEGHHAWAHIDMGGLAFGANPLSKQYSATGFGILLVLTYLEKIASLKS